MKKTRIIGQVLNSSQSSATVSQTLSNFASSVAPDLRNSLAGFIAPEVPVGLSSGQYKLFNNEQAFKIFSTRRAMGGKRNRISFEATDPSFNCLENGLEVALDDGERRLAGSNILNLEQAKVRTLMRNIGLSHEKAVYDKLEAVSAEAGLGNWGDPTVDPIDEIDTLIEAIAKATGMMPNRGVISLSALRLAKNSKKVRDRFPGAASQRIGIADIAALTINPSIDLRVGVLSYDTVKEGATSSKQFIGRATCAVFIGSDNATQDDPSAFKTFASLPLNAANVKTYRDEPCNSDIYCNDWAVDIKQTSSVCVKRIAVNLPS